MIEMKGIQGFARICPGDVFEITLKYGDQQKWKTRGKILKDGKQQWENQQVVFKALLDEVLSIKAVEVRGLGKNLTLENKLVRDAKPLLRSSAADDDQPEQHRDPEIEPNRDLEPAARSGRRVDAKKSDTVALVNFAVWIYAIASRSLFREQPFRSTSFGNAPDSSFKRRV